MLICSSSDLIVSVIRLFTIIIIALTQIYVNKHLQKNTYKIKFHIFNLKNIEKKKRLDNFV